jgi:hypothetical protein
VKSEDGKTMQEKVWTQLARKLEGIDSGCVAAALKVN